MNILRRILSLLVFSCAVLTISGSLLASETLPGPPKRAAVTASANRKLGSDLIAFSRRKDTTSSVHEAGRLSQTDAAVKVVIRSDVTATARIAEAVRRAGGTFHLGAGEAVLATVPVSSLEQLTALAEVRTIRLPRSPVLFQVTTQGSQVIGAPAWHEALVTGAHVKVGILDAGFSGYSRLLGTELPQIPNDHIKSFSGDITGQGQNHGTAVAEIIHDIAPDAELYLVNASNEVELAAAVDWLISQQVHVINASWGYPCDGAVDGTGFVNRLVKQASDAGVLWVNAAGNFAARHWSGSFKDTDANQWNDFAAGDNSNSVYMNAGEKLEVCITWDDWTSMTQDYDLGVWDKDAKYVATSVDGQNGPGTYDPMEILTFTAATAGTYHIGVWNERTTRNGRVHLYAYPQGAQCATEIVAERSAESAGLLDDLRRFRDEVLLSSTVGTSLVAAYYRHSPEVARILLRDPRLGLEALALLRDGRPALPAARVRTEDDSTPFVVPRALVARINRFLDRLSLAGSESLRSDLTSLRRTVVLDEAAGRPARSFWADVLARERVVIAAETDPNAGYMEYTTPQSSILPPGDSPYALTVGAAHWSDDIVEEYSSRGPTADGRNKPDIVAPDGVCTATLGNCDADGFLGTSASTAHATGAAALMVQLHPLAMPDEIRQKIAAVAVDLAPAGRDDFSGAGRLALGSLTGVDAPEPLLPKGPKITRWPMFLWSSVEGATSYRIMMSRSSSTLPRDPEALGCSDCILTATVTANGFALSEPLLFLTLYYWQVQAWDGAQYSEWSPIVSFTTGVLSQDEPPSRDSIYVDAGAYPLAAPGAVVITHGWNADASDWVLKMATSICEDLKTTPRSSSPRDSTLTKVCQSKAFDVWIFDWREKADLFPASDSWLAVTPSEAFNAAHTLGESVASALHKLAYPHAHLIAHSAGSNVIRSATMALRRKAPVTSIHNTFLDAYDPANNPSYYGDGADWADNYVDTRNLSPFGYRDFTKLFLTHAYNVNVTPPESHVACNLTCPHSRPYRFYWSSIASSFEDSVVDRISTGTSYVGFPLSGERGRSLTDLRSDYRLGDTCAMIGNTCVPQFGSVRPSILGAPRVRQTTVEKTSGSAYYELGGGHRLFRRMTLGVVKGQSSDPVSSDSDTPTATPSWLVADITTDSPVNALTFKWRFSSTGEGLLRLFVDDELVRQIDQRHVGAGVDEPEEIYVGGPSGELPAGTHQIVVRFDGFGGTSGSIELTDITFGFRSAGTSKRRSVGRR